MSRRDRSEFVALVAVACTVVVFLIGLAAGLGYPASEHKSGESYQQIQQNAERDVSQADARPDNFNFWQDPFPQYAMAVFAAFATGASFWAIYEVRKTFKETKRTADAAVGDQRPWVSIDLLSVTQTFGLSNYASAVMRFRLDNHGKTPAVQGRLFLNFVRPKGPLDARFNSFMADCAREYAESIDRQRSTVVFPGPGVPFIRSIDEHNIAKPVSVAGSYHVFAAFFYRAAQGQPEPMHIGRAYFIDMKSGDMESDDFTVKEGEDDRAFWATGVVSIA